MNNIFIGNVAYTKNGNAYNKSKTWTITGLGAGAVGGIIRMSRNEKTEPIQILYKMNKFLGVLFIMTLMGSIVDTIINYYRKKAADNIINSENTEIPSAN